MRCNDRIRFSRIGSRAQSEKAFTLRQSLTDRRENEIELVSAFCTGLLYHPGAKFQD